MTEGMEIVYFDGEERARFPYGMPRSILEQLNDWARRGDVWVMTIRDGKELMAAYSAKGQLYWTDLEKGKP